MVEKRKSEYGRLAWLVENIVKEMVAELPPADVKPVIHSHWIHYKGKHRDYVRCAKCGELATTDKYSDYCCNCGSLMDGEVEEVIEEY